MKQRNLFSKPKSDIPKSKPMPEKTVVRSNCSKHFDNERFTQPFKAKAGLTKSEDIRIYEEIQRRRLQILVWSKLYYDMDTSVVSDSTFDQAGKELVRLQAEYPEISKIVAYADEFKDWSGNTGFNLPLQDPWVCFKAQQLIERSRRN